MHLGKDFIKTCESKQDSFIRYMKRTHILFDVFLLTVMTISLASCVITYEFFIQDLTCTIIIMSVFLCALFFAHRYHWLDEGNGFIGDEESEVDVDIS